MNQPAVIAPTGASDQPATPEVAALESRCPTFGCPLRSRPSATAIPRVTPSPLNGMRTAARQRRSTRSLTRSSLTEANQARSADRPELKRMLAYIKEHPDVKYVIVHKVDRLA